MEKEAIPRHCYFCLGRERGRGCSIFGSTIGKAVNFGASSTSKGVQG